jgi:hypothetical protein
VKVRSALREAALNVASGTTRMALHAVMFGAMVAVLAGADVAAIGRIADQAAQYQRDGGSTLVYRLKSAINGEACDGLRHLSGVKASGAVRQRNSGVTPVALPAQQVPTFDVSPGFGGFTALGHAESGNGVLISRDVAQGLGLAVGERLPLRGGRPQIGAIFDYPPDGRQPGYGYSVLVPTDTRAAFDECWVEVWPAGEGLISTLPVVLVPGASGGTGATGPQLLQLNAARGSHFDGPSIFAERVTRFSPAVAGVIAFGLGFGSTRRRKLELAAARHAGVRLEALTLQHGAETLAWTTAGCLLALPPIMLTFLGQAPEDHAGLRVVVLATMLMAAASALLGAIAATFSVKEHHLFAYFKGR